MVTGDELSMEVSSVEPAWSRRSFFVHVWRDCVLRGLFTVLTLSSHVTCCLELELSDRHQLCTAVWSSCENTFSPRTLRWSAQRVPAWSSLFTQQNVWRLVMAALRSRCGHYIFALWSVSFCLFSSPNLSGCRLDVYHTSTHGVALVLI